MLFVLVSTNHESRLQVSSSFFSLSSLQSNISFNTLTYSSPILRWTFLLIIRSSRCPLGVLSVSPFAVLHTFDSPCTLIHHVFFYFFRTFPRSFLQLNPTARPKAWPVYWILQKSSSNLRFLQRPHNIVRRATCESRCHWTWNTDTPTIGTYAFK